MLLVFYDAPYILSNFVPKSTQKPGDVLLPKSLKRKTKNYHVTFYKCAHAASSSGVFQSFAKEASAYIIVSGRVFNVSYNPTNPFSHKKSV